MEAATGYHEKLINLSREIVEHGWGKCEVVVESGKDNTVKVLIKSGKHYVFFIKKNIRLDQKDVF